MSSPKTPESSVSETQVGNVGERLLFIDFARGIVMILMAWDHVSEFWNPGKMGGEGLRGYFPLFINFTQFMLRFITHVCAPTFMFLAGTSLALSVRRRQARGESEFDISKRLVARGTLMWLFAIYVVGPAFGSGPLYFGVLACFGLSFILWSVLRKLHTLVILAASIIMILFHPSLNLDFIPNTGLAYYLRVIIHEPAWMGPRWPFGGLYPIVPWIGVLGLGWGFGDFLNSYDKTKIQNLKLPLVAAGVGALILFVAVRWFNGFGVLVPRQGNTLMDWLSVAKYPPSLAFLLVTLGEMCFLLAIGLLVQRLRNPEKGVTGMVLLFGRIPLFFYLSHLVLYRLRPFWMTQSRLYDLTLWETGAFWVIGIAILWWLGGHYLAFKRSHRESLLQYI